ncbi:MAG TPA: lysine--tRNA ligase [Candidatus Paceibacterota bacterium]|nr:lysine--tRNA ligase [Candidatus Paceibacterota bacterium]
MNSGDSMRAERLKKLDILKSAGINPYPASTKRTGSIADFVAKFAEGQEATLAGRVMSVRGQGGIMFADIYDGTGRIQVVLQKDDLPAGKAGAPEAFDLFDQTVDQGDFIEATGAGYTTKRGSQSLKAASWAMLAKALSPLPGEWQGLQDPELKLRQRYLDILLDPELRAMFERRTKFWQTIRQFYIDKGFMEVDTPVLETSPGGADARPFETRHNALDIDVNLRISLELWLKRLLVAGFPKVFEIGRIFRNEGQSREHLQDYTQWESYEAYSDLKKGGEFVKELYRRIATEVYGKTKFEINGHVVDLAKEWEVIDFCKVIKDKFGIDPLTATESEAIAAVEKAGLKPGETLNLARAVDYLWKSVRKSVAGPAFLVGVPAYLEPLAKRYDKNPKVVERLQVILAGSEVGKGFSELNDPIDQRARFEEQQKMRDAGDPEAQRLDEEYVEAMEYGMPPSFGFGMSERLFSFLENRPIHEAQLFPLLRPKGK